MPDWLPDWAMELRRLCRGEDCKWYFVGPNTWGEPMTTPGCHPPTGGPVLPMFPGKPFAEGARKCWRFRKETPDKAQAKREAHALIPVEEPEKPYEPLLNDEQLQAIADATQDATAGPIELLWPKCDEHGVRCVVCAESVHAVILPERGEDTRAHGDAFLYEQIYDFSADFWKWVQDVHSAVPLLLAHIEAQAKEIERLNME